MNCAYLNIHLLECQAYFFTLICRKLKKRIKYKNINILDSDVDPDPDLVGSGFRIRIRIQRYKITNKMKRKAEFN